MEFLTNEKLFRDSNWHKKVAIYSQLGSEGKRVNIQKGVNVFGLRTEGVISWEPRDTRQSRLNVGHVMSRMLRIGGEEKVFSPNCALITSLMKKELFFPRVKFFPCVE